MHAGDGLADRHRGAGTRRHVGGVDLEAGKQRGDEGAGVADPAVAQVLRRVEAQHRAGAGGQRAQRQTLPGEFGGGLVIVRGADRDLRAVREGRHGGVETGVAVR